MSNIKRASWVAGVVMLSLVVGAPWAHGTIPVSLTTADGAGADTYVQRYENVNRGTEVGFIAQNQNRKSYLRFDLSSLDRRIGTAALKLNVSLVDYHLATEKFTLAIYGLNDGHVGENWGETDITWNTAPANLILSNDFDPSMTTLLGTIDVYGKAVSQPYPTVTFSNATLAAFLNADSNGLASLLIRYESKTMVGGSVVVFASKEHASMAAPTLDLGLLPPRGTVVVIK